MKTTVLGLLASACLATSATAATIEFDIGDLTFSDMLNGIAPYQMGGDTTFLFDTTTEVVSGVGVISPETGVSYNSGTWNGGAIELQSAGTAEINLDPFVTIAELEALPVGGSLTRFPAGDEVDPGSFFAFVNGGVTAKRLTDVPAVPLPASFPLLLIGLGVVAVTARRKTAT